MTRILLSALSARRGGGLTYLRRIVEAFPRDLEHRLAILSATPIEGLPPHPAVEWVQAPRWTVHPIFRFVLGSVYFRHLWHARHDYDLVYFAGGSFDLKLPRSVRTAVAFRNMLPFDPESARRYPLGWMRFRHWLLKYVQSHAFRTADLVIFISDYARQVIDARVRRRGTAAVIPHGVSPTTAPLDPVLADRLPNQFVLYLSILDYYKAQLDLIDAWAVLRSGRSTPEKLVLAGPENPGYGDMVRNRIAQLGLEDEVILLGGVHHDQVFDLAGRAHINLFMSACENCPNIMLELMRVGKPMLISSREPMPELGGPDLDYVDPYDVEAIAAALSELLDDANRRIKVATAAQARSERFSWEDAGRKTWDAILAAARARQQ